MPGAVRQKLAEALEVQGNLVGHACVTDADDGGFQITSDPGRQRVGQGGQVLFELLSFLARKEVFKGGQLLSLLSCHGGVYPPGPVEREGCDLAGKGSSVQGFRLLFTQ